MTNCPKCGKPLGIRDWKQNCPNCGTNIPQYDMFERLMHDADVAEVQHYYFQIKAAQIKAAFIGSKLAIMRIIASILPIGAIFLPLVRGSFSPPLAEHSGNASILTLFSCLSDIDFQNFIALSDNTASKPTAFCLAVSAVAFLLSCVLIISHLILLALSRSPKGKPRNLFQDILMIALAVISCTAFSFLPANAFALGRLGIGAYLYLLLLAVNLIVDLLALKEEIEIKPKQCFVGGIPIERYFELVESYTPEEEIREEMYRCLKESTV